MSAATGGTAMVFFDQLYRPRSGGVGGMEAHTRFLAEAISPFRSVTVLGRIDPGPGPPRYPLSGHVRFEELPAYDGVPSLCMRLPVLAPSLARAVHRALAGADAAFLEWPHPVSAVALLLSRLGARRALPVLLVLRDYPAAMRARYRGVRRAAALLLGLLMERAARLLAPDAIVLAAGEPLRRRYLSHFRDCHSISVMALSAADLPARPPRGSGSAAPRRLLFVGRLAAEKGADVLLRAAATLVGSGIDVRVDVVGDGEEAGRLRSLATESGLGDRVAFHGHVVHGQPLLRLFQRADLTVVPSLAEGLPNVVIESMALGTPVVATRVGGIADVVRDGETGWLAEPGSVEGLADAVRRAIDSDRAHDRVREAAVRRVRPLLAGPQRRIIEAAVRRAWIARGFAPHRLGWTRRPEPT